MKRGIDNGIANNILIKVNQIGTVTETINAVQMAQYAGYTTIARATEAVKLKILLSQTWPWHSTADKLKRVQQVVFADRMAKYNQLVRIEEMLGDTGIYQRQI